MFFSQFLTIIFNYGPDSGRNGADLRRLCIDCSRLLPIARADRWRTVICQCGTSYPSKVIEEADDITWDNAVNNESFVFVRRNERMVLAVLPW